MPDSAAVHAFPERPENRLRHALRGLEEALAAQRLAVLSLRDEMRGLSGALAGLAGSWQAAAAAGPCQRAGLPTGPKDTASA